MEVTTVQMTSSKAQVSFEFITIFALIFFALAGFFYIMNERMSELAEKREYNLMSALANSIINEVVVASSVSNNYMRKFEIPTRILGEKYNMSIEQDEIAIRLIEGNRVRKEYYAAFPIPVKGTFIENIGENTTGHCVTRSDYDGVRISQNQVSIDSENDTVKVGDSFKVYVALYCVENALNGGFTLHYDQTKLELVKAVPVVRNITFRENNPLFPDEERVFNYAAPLTDSTIGRFSYSVLSKECVTGSGNIAQLTFKALAEGDSWIEFDETYDDNVVIYDCHTTKFTKDALPSSRKEARVVILPP